VRNAVSLLLESGADRLLVLGEGGKPIGVLPLSRASELLQR